MKRLFDKIHENLYVISLTVIITFALTFMTLSAYYNGFMAIKPNVSSKFNSVLSLLNNKYYEDYDKKKAEDAAIDSYVNSLGDVYTEYMDENDVKEFETLINGNYCGIGVVVTHNMTDNTILVLEVYEGSPAEEAGIEAGDVLTKVNGVEYKGEQLNEATDNIKGEEGTQTEVSFIKASDKNEYTKSITRKSIDIKTVKSDILEDNIGYISISQFSSTTAKEYSEKLTDLIDNQKVKGLIVDVRNNGGGITTAVEFVADCLLKRGDVIYYTADKYDNKKYAKSKIDGYDLPLVVLCNEYSASASEILVGSIKDNGRGKIVGKKTYGKGLVQEYVDFDDGTALKLTIEKYYTPSGDYINKKGIEPDYNVDLDINSEQDTQLEKAIELLK